MKEDEIFRRALGKRIDELRKKRKLSFQEMSYQCDIEKSNLVKIAKHGENVTANTLFKISKGLDIPLKTIFDFEY